MAFQRLLFLTIAVIFTLGFLAIASPSSYLTADDKAALSRLITSSQKSDGSFLGLKNTYYAVATNNELKRLAKDLSDVPKKDKICEYTKGALKTTDIEDVFYQQYVLDSLQCGQTADDKIKTAVKTALSSSSTKSLVDVSYGIQAATLLKEKIDPKVVLDKILAHVDLDGDALFKANVDEEEGSVYLTGLALEALASLAASGADKTKLTEVLNSATKTLFSRFAEENDDVVYFIEEGFNSFKVTSQVVKGIFSLASALDKKPSGLTAEQVNAVAEYLVQNKQVGGVDEAFYLLGSLTHLSNNKFFVPLVVSIPSATLSASAKGNEGAVNVRLTDVVGNPPATKAKVSLVKAYQVNRSDKPISTSQEFSPVEGSEGLYQFNLVGTGKTELGYYVLEIKVTPDANSKYLPVENVHRNVKVVGEATVADCQITVTDLKGAEVKKYGCDSGKNDFSVVWNHTIHLTFAVKSANKAVQVQQAFVRLTLSSSKLDKILVVPFNGKQHALQFSFKDLAPEFYGTSGKYSAELIVGDAFLANPTVTKLPTISVDIPDSLKAHQPASPFDPKPIIEHQFRAAEKRPPIVISTAFTAAVLVPGLILFIGFLRIGANISNFPFSGTAFINAVGFQGTLGAILALFALFWLRLNMIQTLVYLGFLSIPFLYFANNNLSYLATKNSKSS